MPFLSRACPMVEVRVEVDPDSKSLAVIDGYCKATGKTRSDVMRFLMDQFADEQVHVARMVLRFAGINATSPESVRNHGDA